MRRIGLLRLIAVATITSVFAFVSPAWANSTINMNNSGQNQTAAGFPTHICTENQGGGPYAGQDVWIFNLPGNHDVTGDFVTVTANFSTSGGPVTKIIPTDGGGIVLELGTSRAFIATPAGWTLLSASAEITGTADFFVLTHTCPSSGEPSESPSPQPSGSTQPSETPSPGASGSTDPGTNSPSNPPLPRTGTAIMSIVFSGMVAIAGGAALLFVLRRRRDALMNASDE